MSMQWNSKHAWFCPKDLVSPTYTWLLCRLWWSRLACVLNNLIDEGEFLCKCIKKNEEIQKKEFMWRALYSYFQWKEETSCIGNFDLYITSTKGRSKSKFLITYMHKGALHDSWKITKECKFLQLEFLES